MTRFRADAAAALAGGLASWAALAAVLALSFGSAGMALLHGWGALDGGAPAWRASDTRALEFTLRQAALSALISTAAAVPLARALARRRFWGRDAAIALLGAPFLLPTIVAILGVVAVWGRSGLVADAAAALGLPRPDIYGLPGVLLAHVFFNLPLATRIFLQGYAAIPAERWRLAEQLGLEGRALFARMDWPMLRESAPGAFALIFLVCVTSFAVALALGGGPRATTLELAIYQALRFDFDLARAALLALAQLGLCMALAALTLALSRARPPEPGLRARIVRRDGRGRAARATDAAALIAAGLFLGLPLGAALARGAAGLAALPAQAWPAAGRSLMVALGSATLCMALALGLATLALRLERRPWAARAVEAAGLSALAAPPFVMGMGLFLALRPLTDPFALALPITAAINAAMALPFALGLILPALRRARAEYGPLADQLGLRGLARLRAATWPALRRPLGLAAGLAAALAAGDLGVIALFAPADGPTLPLLVQRLMAGYRWDAAAGASLLLLALSFGLFLAFDLAARSLSPRAARRRGRGRGLGWRPGWRLGRGRRP
ncbi:hypothetical protein [Oceanicella actignis]|uniref:Thiamine transport system permease protein n=1 Tax=Oceanicella actignis TaxID=1189325 RepID=A0A1M7T9R5_9RHOB|nr:hypothetical protein [Oceanicella actignis]SET51212.1 thiamine transport system permease protein [Oceanicella actignis]SHN67413.1 thiamine transport system permease protein [Oceanicella actignis]